MKCRYFREFNFLCVMLLVSLLFSSEKIISQCAGTSNTVVICDKELDTNLQNFNLFDQLLGTPVLGGTWTTNDPLNFNVLDSANNTVNLWAINRSGDHTFVYTNDACNETATITISLGGYPGEDNLDGGANACSDDVSVNLFTFLDNELLGLNVDINGTWTGVGIAANNLTEESFNAKIAGPGTYTFTYTVDEIETCISKTATIVLEVHKSPNSGIGRDIIICDSEDFSIYTDFDLFDLILGANSNGIWTELDGTSQISSGNDSVIDIEEIYNNMGNGNYAFSYSVFPTHGVCDVETTTVNISIPRLFGEFSIPDFCGEELSQITIVYDNPSSISFEHELTYEIQNSTTNEIIFSSAINVTPIVNIIGPTTSAVLNTNIPITTPGTYTISATSIDNVTGLNCASLSIADDTFTVYNPEASIEQTCFEKDDITDVTITNYTNANGDLINETKTVSYNILYNGTLVTVDNYELTFTNGTGTIPVDLSLFPDSTEGDINITFNDVVDDGLRCVNFSFPVIFVPNDIELSLVVDNICDASSMEVNIDAPTLADGRYTITYEVTEIGNPELLVNNEINITGGQANYQVDISNLNVGNYNITLKSIQDDTTPCRTEFEFELIENFSINGIPDAPTLSETQSFCFSDYPPNGPTLAAIIVDTGENLTWYEDETSTDALDITTLLMSGENYYVTAQDTGNTCDESPRSMVSVTVNTTAIPTSNDETPTFCSSDASTLASLDITAENGGDIVWYDSSMNGNILPDTTILEDNMSYYALEKIGDCESERLQFDITIISPSEPINSGSNIFCVTKDDTIASIASNFSTETQYDLVWFDATNTQIDTTTVLEQNAVYYVASTFEDSGCFSDTLEFTINITSIPVAANDIVTTFCASDNATLASLNVTTENGGDLVWYDSMSGGTLLETTTVLTNATNYYAFETLGDCISDALEISITVISPPIPEYTGSNPICVAENSTIADLENLITIDNAYVLVWYDATNTVIDSTTILEQDEIYSVASTFEDSGCFSDTINISVNITVSPTAENTDVVFCDSENATIAALEVTSSTGGDLIWYDTITDGNVLPEDTNLVNGSSYYVVEKNGDCESVNRLQFNVTIISPQTPIYTGETSLCALDQLTLLDLEENITVADNAVLVWYDEVNNELNTADLLEENFNYYVATRESDYSCESEPILISVTLSNCDPEKYEFFIPDGFSPNGDSINDTFHIPNIAFFYPNYDYEIFNRYGQSLFKGDINNPAWDGTSNNSQTETTSGVYFYILNYNYENLKPEQGRIYLSK